MHGVSVEGVGKHEERCGEVREECGEVCWNV